MSDKVIIICGSRDWDDPVPIRELIKQLRHRYGEEMVIVHGDCRGADRIAKVESLALGVRHHPEPAEWGGGRRAGPERNARMLAMGPVEVFAFKKELAEGLGRGGTENMLKIALESGVRCTWRPNGVDWIELD